jgi:hypothetical protein
MNFCKPGQIRASRSEEKPTSSGSAEGSGQFAFVLFGLIIGLLLVIN